MPRDEQGRKVIVFDDFTKGEYGTLVPIETGDRGRSGMWTGTCVTVLPDGSLTAAPDPKAMTTTLPGGGLAGAVVDLGMGYKSTGSVVWFKGGNKIYQSAAGPAFTVISTLTGTSANALSYIDRVATNTSTYAITSTNVLELIDHAAGSVGAAGGTPPSCSTVTQYGDRLMLSGSGANANRLYFSAAGNFASWPAANYIDIGSAAPIVALIPMRGFLVIAKSAGEDDTWWTLRGVPGVNAVLRRSSRFQSPAGTNRVVLLNDNRVAFTVPTFTNGGVSAVVPARFDGASGALDLDRTNLLNNANQTEAYRMADGNDVMFKQQNQALIRRRSAWALHTLPVGLYINATNFALTSRSMAMDQASGTFYLMNTAGDTFYKWHPYVQRPAFTADTDAAAPTVPQFTLPEWRAAAGEEVCAQAVVVAFRVWDAGGAAVDAKTFSLRVRATGTYPSGATGTVISTDGWTEAATGVTNLGGTARATFTVTPGWGNGFIVDFPNLVGVAIRSVTVVCATRPMPGVP